MNNTPLTPEDAIRKGRTAGVSDLVNAQAEQERLRAPWKRATQTLEDGLALLRDQEGSGFTFRTMRRDPLTRVSTVEMNVKGPDGGKLEAVVDKDGLISLFEYNAGQKKNACLAPQTVMAGAKDPNVPLMVITRLAVTNGLIR